MYFYYTSIPFLCRIYSASQEMSNLVNRASAFWDLIGAKKSITFHKDGQILLSTVDIKMSSLPQLLLQIFSSIEIGSICPFLFKHNRNRVPGA